MEAERQTDDVPAQPRRRPWRLVLIGAGVLVVVGAVAWAGARAGATLVKTKAPVARLVGNPVQVRAVAVTREDVREVIGGTTLGQPLMSVAVNVAVSEGLVKTVPPEIGKVVAPGDVLLEFETNVFREALERAQQQGETARADMRKIQAEAVTRVRELNEAVAVNKQRVASWQNALETATTTLQRLKVLLDQKVVALAEVEQARLKVEEARSGLALSQLDLVRAENELRNEPVATRAALEAVRFKLEVAEQEVAQARRNMQNTRVRAPSAGVVAQRNVQPGEWVKNGKTAFMLDLITPIYAVAEIEQEKSRYVAVEQTATVVFDAHPTRVFTGKVAKIDPTIDPVKRTFKTFVRLDNADLALRPGMAAFTRITRTREVTLMPRVAAINPTGAPSIDASVFVLQGSEVSMRKVKLGRPEGLGRVEVLSGIEPGEVVVVWGQQNLKAGDRVEAQIVELKDGAASPASPARVVGASR